MITRKKITAVFLLSCFSVMLGHSLIPHHHHDESGKHIISDHCTADKKDHSDEETPLHCHAFNGSSFLKSAVIKVKQPVLYESYIMVLDDILVCLPIFTDQDPCLIFKDPFKEPDFIGSSPRRGPPRTV